jgi:large subunit ribosomal protein L21
MVAMVNNQFYAVFEDGSRQYRVSEGDVVTVDYRDVEVGKDVELTRVLLYKKDADIKIGLPLLEGMRILGTVVDHPSTKLYIQKFRKRKNYRRLRGHRQHYTAVKVDQILLPGEAPRPRQAPAAPPAPTPAGTEAPPAPAQGA